MRRGATAPDAQAAGALSEMSMPAVLTLTLAAIWRRKARALLTALAIALAVSLVVSVTAGYASVTAAIRKFVSQYLGATDVKITCAEDYHGAVPETLIEEIRRDRDVRAAVGRLEVDLPLVGRDGKPLPGREWQTVTVIGVRLPEDIEIGSLTMEPGTSGQWFSGGSGEVAVIDQEAARLLGAGVGDLVVLPAPGRQLRAKVVGIVHKPQIMAALKQTFYVPLETLQQITGATGKVTSICIDLHDAASDEGFVRRWQGRIEQLDKRFLIKTSRQRRAEIDRDLKWVEFLAMLGGTVSMLAAAFIVFATLSMGVAERQRTLSMLLAVGAAPWQIGATVVLEGLLLACAGAIVGIPLGILWAHITAALRPMFFLAGVALSIGGILYGAVGSLLAALAAAVLPALQAMRLDPVEGMSVQARRVSRRSILASAAVGVVLVLVDPLLLFVPAVPRPVAFWGHFYAGLPCLMIGFFLLAPLLVEAVDRTLGFAAAGIFAIRRPLLSQLLSGAIWRAAGTSAALMVGLAILIVLHTQGNSAMRAWRLPDRFPDLFILAPFGLTKEQTRVLETVEGIRSGEVLPLAVATSGLGQGFFSFVGAAFIPDATMFIGIDVDRAMKMMELNFRRGTPEQAARLLRQGRHLIVTEEFHRLKGLDVGDKLTLKTPKSGDVEYTIAGVVWSPGIDVFVSMFDMGRQFEQRSAGSVFGSLEDAERDFGVDRYRLFAANLDHFVERQDIEQRVRSRLGAWGLRSGDVRQIKYEIQQTFRRMLSLVSIVALAAIVVASFGVTNAIMASIHSRRWQLGVLRSIGLTQGQMLRMILAEGLLLGFSGCALGLLAGLEMSINANALGRRIFGFAPPIALPWDMIALGAGIIMLTAVAASVFPAASAARQDPLDLLQVGRAG